MPSRVVAAPEPISVSQTLGPLVRGRGDPTMRVARGEAIRASRTPDGPVSVAFREIGRGVEVEAWGPGSGWVLERAEAWCGALDDVSTFAPPSGIVRDVWRRTRGMRIPATGLITERLIPVILEQKVTGMEARRAYRAMTLALGDPAPGDLGLRLPPDLERIAELPYERFHPFGIERRRAEVIREVARRRTWVDAAAELPLSEARARIRSLRGVGPWSVAEVGRLSLGDADAVSVGDFHVPNIVAWALAREPRGSDERMLELLEPFAPHRGRTQRLIEMAGLRPPKFGPRMEVRSIPSI
ncbi:MAG TPA: DNA-3-methyladenine glycosylase 2 family protein [Actinomycetota bacterium]|nr:DNA-3-methyladenine glycosylase 2 family protein [Actinomycetota bacterium]